MIFPLCGGSCSAPMDFPESAGGGCSGATIGQLMRPPIIPRNALSSLYRMSDAQESVASIRQFRIPNNTDTRRFQGAPSGAKSLLSAAGRRSSASSFA
jgi:hypothetical protein